MWFFKKKKKKIALVLGSGGARGLAHVGVIKSLVKNKINIDLIVGSSSGALIGGYYSYKKNIEELEKLVREVSYKDLVGVMVDPTWGGGLIKGNKTLEYLKKLYENTKIENLTLPFVAVATDVNTAEPVIFSKGDLAEAVRSSISIPLVYSPIQFGDKLLVDGGVSYPVPVEIAKKMGAEIIIAVNLDGVYFSADNHKETVNSSTIEVLKGSYYALRYNLAKKEVREADVVIEPEMKYISDFDFVGGEKAIDEGIIATEKVMEKIKRLL